MKHTGYQPQPLVSVPFDKEKSIISNLKGKVVPLPGKEEEIAEVEGMYCSGWAKRGPKGII
ncbi:unnamed protein product, partial [Heterosigma akashiwo]